jgi:hypothetical protein
VIRTRTAAQRAEKLARTSALRETRAQLQALHAPAQEPPAETPAPARRRIPVHDHPAGPPRVVSTAPRQAAPALEKDRPLLSPSYLALVRELPCALSGRTDLPRDAHHHPPTGRRGVPLDLLTLPVTREQHALIHAGRVPLCVLDEALGRTIRLAFKRAATADKRRVLAEFLSNLDTVSNLGGKP